jgi:hypothetical protein
MISPVRVKEADGRRTTVGERCWRNVLCVPRFAVGYRSGAYGGPLLRDAEQASSRLRLVVVTSEVTDKRDGNQYSDSGWQAETDERCGRCV